MHSQTVSCRRSAKVLCGSVALVASVFATIVYAAVEPSYESFGIGDQVIVDSETMLEWQRTPTIKDYPLMGFENAAKACSDFRPSLDAGLEAGSIDAGLRPAWRLPTIKELLSLVDERGETWQGQRVYVSRNAFAPAMAVLPFRVFWSSSAALNATARMVVDFSQGTSSSLSNSDSAKVICVRNVR